jgi:hypothetical protein
MKPYLPRLLQNKWIVHGKKAMEFANIKELFPMSELTTI